MNVGDGAMENALQRGEKTNVSGQDDPCGLLDYVGSDIATNEPPKPREIIPGVLPCASTIFAGAGHEGKTTALLFLSIRIALGLPVFGRDAREGNVLVVFGEDSTDDVRRLVHLIIRKSYPEQNSSKSLNKRLHLLNASKVGGGMKLLREIDGAWQPAEWFSTIEHIVEGQGYSAIVLDTLSSLGLPESSGMNDAAAAYHLAANRIAEAHDLAFIGSHHVSQNVAQSRAIGMYSARGATAITDNARCVIQVQRHKDKDDFAPPFDPAGKFVTRVHIVKHKWSALNADTPLWIESENYRCIDHAELRGQRLTDAKNKVQREQREIRRKRRFDQIKTAIDDCEKLNILTTKDHIADYVEGLGVNKVKRCINQMVSAGDLVEESISDGKAGRNPKVYRLKRLKESQNDV